MGVGGGERREAHHPDGPWRGEEMGHGSVFCWGSSTGGEATFGVGGLGREQGGPAGGSSCTSRGRAAMPLQLPAATRAMPGATAGESATEFSASCALCTAHRPLQDEGQTMPQPHHGEYPPPHSPQSCTSAPPHATGPHDNQPHPLSAAWARFSSVHLPTRNPHQRVHGEEMRVLGRANGGPGVRHREKRCWTAEWGFGEGSRALEETAAKAGTATPSGVE